MTSIRVHQHLRYHFFYAINLRVANKQSFCAYCFFSIVFKNILTILRNTRLILTFAIPKGVPMTVVNEQRETPLCLTE